MHLFICISCILFYIHIHLCIGSLLVKHQSVVMVLSVPRLQKTLTSCIYQIQINTLSMMLGRYIIHTTSSRIYIIYIWPSFGVLSERLWNRWIPRCFFFPLDERSTTRHAPILREKQNDPRTCWDLLGCQGNCHALRITGNPAILRGLDVYNRRGLQTSPNHQFWDPMILRVEIISCITIIMIIFIVMMNTVCIETVFFMFYFWSLKCVQLGV